MRTRLLPVIAGALLAAFALVATGCELLVQLDRSAVDAGEDTGCPICTDDIDGGDDSSDAAATTDVDAASLDTGPVTVDSSADAGDG